MTETALGGQLGRAICATSGPDHPASRSRARTRPVAVATALVLSSLSGTALAQTISVVDTLPGADSQVSTPFSVASPTELTFRSYSYAGGTNIAGQAITAGGFDPIISVFDQGGNLVFFQDDGPLAVPVDPATGADFDFHVQQFLQPGDYQAIVTAFENFPAGTTLQDGFTEGGAIEGRTDTIAYDIFPAGSVPPAPPEEPTPEPTTPSELLQSLAQNPQQASVGETIGTLCPRLDQMAELTTDQSDLLSRCTGVIVLGTTDSTGVPPALAAVAGEEISVVQNLAAEAPALMAQNIAGRISALRLGASGISLAGLQLYDSDGQRMPVEAVGEQLNNWLRGGAAGSGDDVLDRLSLFVSGSFNTGQRDGTSLETGFDFDTYSITWGVDYRFADNFISGISLGYVDTEIDMDANQGEVETSGFTGALYATWYLSDIFSAGDVMYIDAYGGAGGSDYDSTRNIVYVDPSGLVNRQADGDTNISQAFVSLGAGYDFSLNAWTFGPDLHVNGERINVGSYEETGASGLNLRFEDQDISSVTTELGAHVSYAISTGIGVIVPQGRARWVHEFANDAQVINAGFVADPTGTPYLVLTEDPDRNYAIFGAGVSGEFGYGVSAFVDYEGLVAHKFLTSHVITAGARLTF